MSNDYHFIKIADPYYPDWAEGISFIESGLTLKRAQEIYQQEYLDDSVSGLDCYIIKGEIIQTTDMPEPTDDELFKPEGD